MGVRRIVPDLHAADPTASRELYVDVLGLEVDDAHAAAIERGFEILHSLTDEPWGVRRFFVRDPASGAVLNVLAHARPAR
ncbi:MAG TPA: hypothetical protein VN238_22945 [Solirubrobacteraceae bacterium]|nr:hypothetical protein [Solirubrobacteraceae bacterium]